MLSLTQPSTSASPPASTDPLHHNLVDRWFSELTTKLLKTRAAPLGPSPQQRHGNWIEDWNENPRPYIWTKTADQILDSIKRYCKRTNGSGHCVPFDTFGGSLAASGRA